MRLLIAGLLDRTQPGEPFFKVLMVCLRDK